MTEMYFPVLLAFGVAVTLAATLFGISHLLSVSHPTKEKLEPYECGIPTEGTIHVRHTVKFFLTAVLFLLFDVEVVFLFPWGAVFRDFVAEGHGVYMLGCMGFFLLLLEIALFYVLKKGALEWE